MATWTPWGESEYTEKLERGIAFLGTAGHGGYRVSAKKLRKACSEKGMSVHCTREDSNYVWFEEDCEWSFVALLFPHLFSDKHIQSAKQTIQSYWPELLPA